LGDFIVNSSGHPGCQPQFCSFLSSLRFESFPPKQFGAKVAETISPKVAKTNSTKVAKTNLPKIGETISPKVAETIWRESRRNNFVEFRAKVAEIKPSGFSPIVQLLEQKNASLIPRPDELVKKSPKMSPKKMPPKYGTIILSGVT
jgi:hypothetical protein